MPFRVLHALDMCLPYLLHIAFLQILCDKCWCSLKRYLVIWFILTFCKFYMTNVDAVWKDTKPLQVRNYLEGFMSSNFAPLAYEAAKSVLSVTQFQDADSKLHKAPGSDSDSRAAVAFDVLVRLWEKDGSLIRSSHSAQILETLSLAMHSLPVIFFSDDNNSDDINNDDDVDDTSKNNSDIDMKGAVKMRVKIYHLCRPSCQCWHASIWACQHLWSLYLTLFLALKVASTLFENIQEASSSGRVHLLPEQNNTECETNCCMDLEMQSFSNLVLETICRTLKKSSSESPIDPCYLACETFILYKVLQEEKTKTFRPALTTLHIFLILAGLIRGWRASIFTCLVWVVWEQHRKSLFSQYWSPLIWCHNIISSTVLFRSLHKCRIPHETFYIMLVDGFSSHLTSHQQVNISHFVFNSWKGVFSIFGWPIVFCVESAWQIGLYRAALMVQCSESLSNSNS